MILSIYCKRLKKDVHNLFLTWFIIPFAFFFINCSFSQVVSNPDSVFGKRNVITGVSLSAFGVGSLIGLNQLWYSKFPKSKLHSFNDADEWFQMDKMGHAFTAYQISRSMTSILKWNGLSLKKARFTAAGIAFTYLTTIELMDGKSEGWGFSWSDVGANSIGSILSLIQPAEEYFFLKQSYHPTSYASLRPNVLGTSAVEKYLKDYNGQTYWLSFSPNFIFPSKPIPEWLLLSFGYGVDAKLYAKYNDVTFPGGSVYNAKRVFLLSLDLNVSRLPIKIKWVRTILKPFSAIKIPFPAFYWKGEVCYFNPFYF